MISFAEFDSFLRVWCVIRGGHIPENIGIADYVDHIRAFGRFLPAFAGRAALA